MVSSVLMAVYDAAQAEHKDHFLAEFVNACSTELWHLMSLIHMTQLITCLRDNKSCWNSKQGFKFQTYPVLYSVDR
jgi:hypothetical protein